jgi:hypothetical protein
MRAIRRRCLAPIILAIATTIAAGPAHHGGPVSPSTNLLAAHVCPAGSNWDNVLKRCV